jgi:X-Pro dipeptidyl-peptidase (S15 family)
LPGACIEYDVPVEMRDGTVLRADVYRPVGEGPWPVIVARTPYDKYDPYVTMLLDPLLAVRHGLIAVIQDVRGRYASEGQDFVPFATEAQDGADTVAWARLDRSSRHVETQLPGQRPVAGSRSTSASPGSDRSLNHLPHSRRAQHPWGSP